MKRFFPFIVALLLLHTSAQAQTTASSSCKPSAWAPAVPFDISDVGTEYVVSWGIDTAWLWSWWPLRATNHMRECVSIGRVTIDPRVSGTYSELSSEQKSQFDTQLSWLTKSGVKDIVILAGNASGNSWSTAYRTTFVNDLALAATYIQNKGYNVLAISHFNEPDYSPNKAPGAAEMATIARLMHQNEVLKDIPVMGPSCLNPDYANSWWNTMKDDIDIGNTHQLAGTFNNFAAFYDAVKSSGKPSAGDEMHNTNDALVGINHGMTIGIWWSDFAGYTRAELGRATGDGTQLAYKENRNAWTSASVFKRKSENLCEAFLGTSERQAGESAFCFVSQDRLAYFDGNGPYYDYTKATKGGTGYQNGQTNSEYVIEITTGEDVPVAPLEGDFKIVNKATWKDLCATAYNNNASITQMEDASARNNIWTLQPVDMSKAGDFAYVTITAKSSPSAYLDGVKYEGSNGARIIMYAGGGNECERWHFHYVGNGYYLITNHDSGLSLEGSSNNSSSNTTDIVQWERTGSDRQLWKLVPADATVDFVAPAPPQNLKCEGRSASIALSWDANVETDLLGYMVYRYNEKAGIWETIGRRVNGTEFVDNICPKGRDLCYRVRAIDKAWNISEPSEETSASTTKTQAIIARFPLTENLEDKSENHLDATSTGALPDNSDTHGGAVFDGADDYLSLPYHLADLNAISFSAWVKPAKTTAWQRIFDFGRNTENYLFLTNSNGNVVRFEICKDGEKQGVNGTKRLPTSWTYVTVTLENGTACIYLNGSLDASSTEITLRPSDVRPILSYLGRSMFDADPLFNGTIGDVRIFNYALSAEEVKNLYNESFLAPARDLLNKPMYKIYKDALQQALTTAELALQTGDDDVVAAAYSSLNSAMTTAKKSAAYYEPLGEWIEWSQQMADNFPQTTPGAADAYRADLDLVMENYYNGEYTHSRITTVAIVEVKRLTNHYLMADASLQATEKKPVDISHLLLNPSFSDNNLDNWSLTTAVSTYKGNLDYQCLEIAEKSFTLGQTLYGMPSGTYRLSTQAFYRNGPNTNATSTEVNATLFIGSETHEIVPISQGANSSTSDGTWYSVTSSKKVPDDLEAASAAFNKLSRYRPLQVTGRNTMTADYDAEANNRLNVGLKKSKTVTGDWTVVNYFQLYYLGGNLLPGDVNEDGIVDINDVVALINHIAGVATYARANVNEDTDADGTPLIDINDIVAVINFIASQ